MLEYTYVHMYVRFIPLAAANHTAFPSVRENRIPNGGIKLIEKSARDKWEREREAELPL